MCIRDRLIAGGLGFGPLETSILIASALFVSGICTFVQSFGVGPLGAKIPMVQVGSFVFIEMCIRDRER